MIAELLTFLIVFGIIIGFIFLFIFINSSIEDSTSTQIVSIIGLFTAILLVMVSASYHTEKTKLNYNNSTNIEEIKGD